MSDLFVVRLYDGFDHEWMDISPAVPREEADSIYNEKTDNDRKMTKFDDIDYYRIFPADTRMLYAVKDRYANASK